MILKILYALLSAVVLGAGLASASETRWRDGKIEFAVSNVNGETAWSDKEKQALIDKYSDFASTSPISVIDDSPSKREVTLSSSAVYQNYSEFKEAVDGKVSERIVVQVRQKLQAGVDLSDTAKTQEAQSQLNYLKKTAEGK